MLAHSPSIQPVPASMPLDGNHRISVFAWRVCLLLGILPMAVLALPRWLVILLPDQSLLHVLFSLLFPISAWVVRFVVFSRGYERKEHQIWQLAIFMIAATIVTIQEQLLIVFRLLAPDLWDHDINWWRGFWILYIGCLTGIAIALFPFSIPMSAEDRRSHNKD